MVREFRHIEEIVRDTAHDLTDFRIGIIRIAQLLQMIKCVASHIGFDVDAHNMPV